MLLDCSFQAVEKSIWSGRPHFSEPQVFASLLCAASLPRDPLIIVASCRLSGRGLRLVVRSYHRDGPSLGSVHLSSYVRMSGSNSKNHGRTRGEAKR